MTDADWLALAGALREEQCRLIHEGTELEGEALTAEALRRAVSRQGSGLTPTSEVSHYLDIQKSAWRTSRESLARQLRDCLAYRRDDQRTFAGQLAVELRAVNHSNAIPSRLRREGVEWAAKWLEGHR